jgi:hypothetical protein
LRRRPGRLEPRQQFDIAQHGECPGIVVEAGTTRAIGRRQVQIPTRTVHKGLEPCERLRQERGAIRRNAGDEAAQPAAQRSQRICQEIAAEQRPVCLEPRQIAVQAEKRAQDQSLDAGPRVGASRQQRAEQPLERVGVDTERGGWV